MYMFWPLYVHNAGTPPSHFAFIIGEKISIKSAFKFPFATFINGEHVH